MMISNRISVQLEGYFKYKHSLGFHIKAETTVLKNFVRYTLERNYDGPLTKDIVLDWICLRKNSSRKTKGRRLEAISPFAKYIVAFDTEAEMLPTKLFGNAHSRSIPYIYTESETRRLMEECRNLYSPGGLRSLTMSAAIGLLWSSGLRTSELTQLKIRDVDPTKNLLYIWNTKFKKDRIVPLSATTSEKLLEYSRRINNIFGLRDEGEFYFVTTGGKPFNSRGFEYAFTKIRECINAKPAGYPAIRLTDFRYPNLNKIQTYFISA